MDPLPVRPGDVLAGKYRVDRVLGAGGMGVVVAATHLDLFEPRAIKFMLPTALANAESVERFLREARASARLKGEHAVRIHDVGRLENGAPYMVMEHLEGSDLRAVAKSQGPLPPALAALYVAQACEALAEAHAAGVVHRDLKPANLFLTRRPDGSPCIKVLDFGISKVVGGGSPGSDFEMTKTHAVLGSPFFMSPEHMRSAKSVDARTDIWSLGVILYKLVTGRLPFQGENITELVSLVLTTTPTPPSQLRPEIPQAFDAVVLRCLERDLARRFQSVTELAAALAPFAPPAALAPRSGSFHWAAPPPVDRAGSAPAFADTAPAAPTVTPSFGAAPLPPFQGAPRGAPTPTPSAPSLAPNAQTPVGYNESTGASWGQSSANQRTKSRMPLVFAGAAGVIAFSGVVLLFSVGRSAPSTNATVAAPAIESASPPPPTPARDPAPEASALPTAIAASASAMPAAPTSAPVETAAPPPAAKPTSAPIAAKPAIAAPPKALTKPTSTKPSAADPFGTGRK